MRHETHFIRANGLTHCVHDYGSMDDPPAVLLHGFPDSSAVWQEVVPLLTAKGFRIIAPDLRGFGETDMAPRVEDYDIQMCVMPDILAILDALNIKKAHLVGHDFGAPVAWALAAQHKERFETLTAMSVGHVRAFLNAGAAQKWRSLYIVYHQLRGLCEWTYSFNDWALLRHYWSAHGNINDAIALLERTGRLTAGLNWYRANMSFSRMISPPPPGSLGEERVAIPTLGLWSDGEAYLTEDQMINSGEYVDANWTYGRIENASHWISCDQPEKLAELLGDHWRE